MKKLKQGDCEFVLFNTSYIFDINLPSTLSIQQICFLNICSENFFGQAGFLTKEKINFVKESFLLWQNKETPLVEDLMDANEFDECIDIAPYSHKDDLKWDDLESPIFRYITEFMEEVGCVTHKDHLKEIYFEEKKVIDETRIV